MSDDVFLEKFTSNRLDILTYLLKCILTYRYLFVRDFSLWHL